MNIKSKAKLMPVTIQIGKSGLTEFVVDEVKAQLKAKKLIKVKFFRSAIEKKDKKELFKEIADRTGSEIIYQIGFTLALYKK